MAYRYPVRFDFRLSSEMRTAAQAKAQAEDMSLAQVMRKLLRDWLKKKGEK